MPTLHGAVPPGVSGSVIRKAQRRAEDDGRDIGRVLQGAKAKQSGANFEAELESTFTHLALRKEASIVKVEPKIAGWGSSLRVVRAGPFDYCGSYRGRAVAFDAKVETGATSYRHERKKMHQILALREFRDSGGVAFILLHCRELDGVWLLGNDDLDTLLRDTVKVCRRAPELSHFRPFIPRLRTFDRPEWDFLPAAVKLFTP